MTSIEAVPLSEIRENTHAMRDVAKALRELPAQCGQEIRQTTPVVGQEVRDTTTHMVTAGTAGSGVLLILVLIIKVIIMVLGAWLGKK